MAADEDQIPPLPPLPSDEDDAPVAEEAASASPEALAKDEERDQQLRLELGLGDAPSLAGRGGSGIKLDLEEDAPPLSTAAPAATDSPSSASSSPSSEDNPPVVPLEQRPTSILTPADVLHDASSNSSAPQEGDDLAEDAAAEGEEHSEIDLGNIPQLMAAIKNLEQGQVQAEDFTRGLALREASAALQEGQSSPFKRYGQKYLGHIVFGLGFLGLMLLYYSSSFKLALLNLFYLPLIGAAFFVGMGFAVTAALMTVWFVVCLAWFRPEMFSADGASSALLVHLGLWSFFLILAAVAIGYLRRRLQKEIKKVEEINEHLAWQKQQMGKVNEELQDYATDLETRIQERTNALERSLAASSEIKKKIEGILLNTMDASVVQLIMQGKLKYERRTISLLAFQLDNFTSSLGPQAPEIIAAQLNQALQELEPCFSAYHGHLDQLGGDRFLAEFGVPAPLTNHRLMSLVAALEIQRILKEKQFPWMPQIGVATGEALVGMFGGKKQSYTALGTVVQQARELRQQVRPGMILVDAATFAGWEHLFEGRPRQSLAADHGQSAAAIAELTAQLAQETNPREQAALCFQLGQVALGEKNYAQAGTYFKQAVALAGDVTEYKIAFAQATVEAETQLKQGARPTSYELLAIKDPLQDAQKIDPVVVAEYPDFAQHCFFAPAVLLPAEVMDGSLGQGRLAAFLSYALAVKLHLPKAAQIEILNAAYLASLGKQDLAEAILNRKGVLAEEEFEEVRQLPLLSAQRARALGKGVSEGMVKLIECCRERPDGSGHPYGLVGNLTPQGARLIHVADSYAALVSWRPFRSAWPAQKVLAALREAAHARKFDEQAVKTLHEVLHQPYGE